jgi:hypothetical protein
MQTSIGPISGQEWDEYCQKMLELKYPNDYQRVPSEYGGDLGIEGFTCKSGIAFQCYCPDGEPTSVELYEKQRDKITTDINKLLSNEVGLKRILGTTILKQWHFITPRFDNKAIIEHCQRKISRIKVSNIIYIDCADFIILVKDENYFLKEKHILYESNFVKINPQIPLVSPEQISEWKITYNSFYEIIEGKIAKITQDEVKKDAIVNSIIKDFLLGQSTLDNLRTSFPDQYQDIVELKSVWENKIEQDTNSHNFNHPGQYLRRTLDEYKAELEKTYRNDISAAHLEILAAEARSDWIIKCSMDF